MEDQNRFSLIWKSTKARLLDDDDPSTSVELWVWDTARECSKLGFSYFIFSFIKLWFALPFLRLKSWEINPRFGDRMSVGSNSAESSITVRLRPSCDHGPCHLLPSTTPHNPGRRFWRCPLWAGVGFLKFCIFLKFHLIYPICLMWLHKLD